MQTEELLTKRRDLLEKKVAAELERAKVFLKANNKRGELFIWQACMLPQAVCRDEGFCRLLSHHTCRPSLLAHLVQPP